MRTRLTPKTLFGMSARRTTGFATSLSRPVGPDWGVPDSSMPSRRHKPLAVTICWGTRRRAPRLRANTIGTTCRQRLMAHRGGFEPPTP
ncbi:transposase [Rhodosalinus sp. K401]|uniref:transposase n=1 Tax=Rhodosalinus sp. K401 TaxID=3239195 RepID=UPI003526541E